MPTITGKTSWPLGTCPNVRTPISPALTGTVNIYAQGGSISYGYTPDFQSYLPYLKALLDRDAVAHAFVGPYASSTTPSVSCGAVIGSSIAAFSSGGANDVGAAPRLTHLQSAHVMILECTVNTASDATETTNWRTTMEAFLPYCDTLRSNTTLRFVILTDQDAGDATRRARLVGADIRGAFTTLQTNLNAAGFTDRYAIANVRTVTRNDDHMRSEATDNRVHMAVQGAQRTAWQVYQALRNVIGLSATYG